MDFIFQIGALVIGGGLMVLAALLQERLRERLGQKGLDLPSAWPWSRRNETVSPTISDEANHSQPSHRGSRRIFGSYPNRNQSENNEASSPLQKLLDKRVREGRPPTGPDIVDLQLLYQKRGWELPAPQEIRQMYQTERTKLVASRQAVQSEPSNEGANLNQKAIETSVAPSPSNNSGTNDPRTTTLTALAQLSKVIPPPPTLSDEAEGGTEIPLLYDGHRWHYLRLGLDGHWGFFGTTGSGKGNTLQAIALHALALGPERVQLVILDAKAGLDYGFCHKLEHAALYCDEQISEGVNAVVEEMRRRLKLLQQHEVRNISEYHTSTGQTLPWLVVIADEIADFEASQREAIATFARMSRAAGGILLVATQYPTAEVLNTQIQANVTNRVVFRLASSDYVGVALRRRKGDGGTYDPSLITKALPGVAVWRMDGGSEVLGRTPEVTDQWRTSLINALAQRWPKLNLKINGSQVVPLRLVPLEKELFEAGTEPEEPEPVPGTGSEPGLEERKTELEMRLIRDLKARNWSRNEIAAILGGRRQARLDQIRRVLGE